MQSLKNSMTESEHFFEQYSKEYPIAQSTFKQILQIIDQALSQNDCSLLLSQISYIESDNGYLTFQYIGEARYLLRILNIIDLEEKYQTASFIDQITNYYKLVEKYKLSLFALRRILFALSNESVAEAAEFLIQNHLSPFAIYVLLKEELILPTKPLLDKIMNLYHSQWSNQEQHLFKQLINTFSETL